MTVLVLSHRLNCLWVDLVTLSGWLVLAGMSVEFCCRYFTFHFGITIDNISQKGVESQKRRTKQGISLPLSVSVCLCLSVCLSVSLSQINLLIEISICLLKCLFASLINLFGRWLCSHIILFICSISLLYNLSLRYYCIHVVLSTRLHPNAHLALYR